MSTAATTTRRTERRRFSLADAVREFWKHPSPWMIGAVLVGALTARIIVGDWQITDAVVPVVMLAVFPFFEWVVHVFVLHWRPRRVGAVTIDSLLARKHREHHVDPRDVPLIFIPWRALLWVIPLSVAVAVLAVSAGRTRAHLLGRRGRDRIDLRVVPLSGPQRLQAEKPFLPGDLEEPSAASLQERALLVHRDEFRDRRPSTRHLPRCRIGRHLTDGEEPPRGYAWMMIGSPMLTWS